MNVVVRRLSLGARVTLPASEDFSSVSPSCGVEVDVEVPIDLDDAVVAAELLEVRTSVMAKLRQLLVLSALDLAAVVDTHAVGGMESLVNEFLDLDGDGDDG